MTLRRESQAFMNGFGRRARSLGTAISIAIVGLFVFSFIPGSGSRSNAAAPQSSSTSSTSLVATATTVAPHQLVASPRGAVTIVEIGDSLGIDLGWGLGVQLAKSPQVHLIQAAVGSTGLSNPWYYNWPAHLTSLLAANHPQLLIVFLGANDQQNFFVHGQFCQVGTSCWKAEYARRVDAILVLAHRARTQVLWVGEPAMQNPAFSQGVTMINSVVRRELDKAPWATYLSSDAVFTGPRGNFRMQAIVNHVATDIRAPDGIHINYTGENLLAQEIVMDLRATYGLKTYAAQPLRIESN